MRSVDPSTLRTIDLWTFKSAKSNKRYIVEVEYYGHNFIGLKFYWKGVEKSKNRYSLLTYDYEPRTIVMSCIQLMLAYYKKNKYLSFGFVAAPDIEANNHSKPNKRFRFYKAFMLSLFGSKTFLQGYDSDSSLYLLVNNEMIKKGLLDIKKLETEISFLYEGNYNLDFDN